MVAPAPPRSRGAGAKARTESAQGRLLSQPGSASFRTVSPPPECLPCPCTTSRQRSPRARALSSRFTRSPRAASRRVPCKSSRSSGAGSPRPSANKVVSETPSAAAREGSSGSGQRNSPRRFASLGFGSPLPPPPAPPPRAASACATAGDATGGADARAGPC